MNSTADRCSATHGCAQVSILRFIALQLADPVDWGRARLADRVAAAAVETRSAVTPAPALAAAISGKTFRFAENRIGLRSMTLDLTAAEPSYETTLAAATPNGAVRRLQGPIGLDGLFRVREARAWSPCSRSREAG